jgi:hypothetical protein
MMKDEKSFDWVAKLPDYFEKHGLEVVFTQAYEAPRRYLRVWSDLLMLMMEEFAEAIKKQDLQTLVGEAAKEFERGCINTNPFPIVVVGKKPLHS